MKRIFSLCFMLVLLIGFSGCGRYQYHSRTGDLVLANVPAQSITSSKPVALKNVSSGKSGVEEILCQFSSYDVMGSSYDYTASAIHAVKDGVQKKGIAVADMAAKRLELAVIKTTCEKGWNFSAGLWLRVTTGGGLTREYQGSDSFMTGYQMTAGFENAMLQCVEKMLNDPEIVSYLNQ
jgi:hypothetical protein